MKCAPWSSATAAIRPNSVSQAGRSTEPPMRSSSVTAASTSATLK
jgi:hypothetical protein